MDDNHKYYDVIIVGGGLAGLSAAEWLRGKDPNLSLLVLEADERVGGRTCAQEVKIANNPSVEVDLGGEWILGSQINLLQLIDRLGLQTFGPPDNDPNLNNLVQVGSKCRIRTTRSGQGVVLPTKLGWHTGIKSWLAGLELAYIAWTLDRMCFSIDLVNPYNYFGNFGIILQCPSDFDSITVDTYLRINTRFQSVRDIIQIQFQLVCGVDPNRISLLFLLVYVKSQSPTSRKPFSTFLWGDADRPNPVLRVRNGAFQICRRLAKLIGHDLVIKNQVVQSVVYSTSTSELTSLDDDKVYITTSMDQTFECRRVIFAIPPSSLKNVKFTPSLPPMKKFIVERMSMGTSIKFYATYDEPYWTLQGYSGQFVSNGGKKKHISESGVALNGGPIVWLVDGTSQAKVPTLIGFINGRLAVEWSQVNEDELQTAILDQLCSLFGSWAQEPAGFIFKNWPADPFSNGGSFCVPSIGSMFAYHSLRQPFGPLHFAGTETAINCMGTMSGAVESGVRAAVEVMDEIQPQCLSTQDYVLIKDARRYGLERNQTVNELSFTYNVFKWTLLLPVVGIAVGCFAYKMCDRYGRLLIPR